MKKRSFIFILLLTIILFGCENTQSKQSVEKKEEVPVKISVQRTGNILSGIGALKVYIDDEEVFQVSNNTTESVEVIMLEGFHTIQTKGQGDKSKKMEFEVLKDGDNEFYFIAEIDNWWGVKLEEKKYIPISQ